MSIYLTCEAEMDLPKPHYQLVADQVRALFDGQNAVRTAAVADGLNMHNTESVLFHLRKAERLGLVARGVGDTWFPV